MSQARARANKRNAQRSTGPKSQKGKRASSQNAISHGLTQPLDVSSDPNYARVIAALIKDGYEALDANHIASALMGYRRVMEAHEAAYQNVSRPKEAGNLQLLEILILDYEEGFFEYPITPREYRGFKFDYIKTQGKIELEGTEMMRRVKQLKPMIRYQRRAVNQLAKALRFKK